MLRQIRILLVMLLCLRSMPAIYAQTYYTKFPKYFEISNSSEWTSDLLEFEEPVEGFRITFFKTSSPNHKYNGYPYVSIAELDVKDAMGNDVKYSAVTNSLAASAGNGLAALYDNIVDVNGFYQSAYAGDAFIIPNDYVYIEIKFEEPHSSFYFRQVRKYNGEDFPLHFTLSSLGETAKRPFTPDNPAEPESGQEEQTKYYNVTVAAKPASVCYVSGGGSFTKGARTFIHSSLKNNTYKFSHWTLNDEYYSDREYFYYYVDEMDVKFVAHYVFDPSSPMEPEPLPEIKVNPLYLSSNIVEACIFNQASGNEHQEDTWVDVMVTVAKGYEFVGWYSGITLISNSARFNYQMPAEPTTLIAKVSKIVFNPDNPMEPEGSQENVQTTPIGDVNKDGIVNILDIIAIVNYSMEGIEDCVPLYDTNADGIVNILDIIKVVNISME